MAMPGKVRHQPEHIRPHVHFELPDNSTDLGCNIDTLHRNKINSGNQDDTTMLKFPTTKNILWDHSSTGSPAHIGISSYRKPKLCIEEKVLRFAQRHIESSGQPECGCALIGSLTTDEDGQGVTLILDRFDPGEGLTASTAALTSGDMAVPLEIIGNSKKERLSTCDDYVKGLKALKQRCCAKDHIDVGNFLLMKGWCNFYTSGEKNIHHLEFDIITMATEFIAMPITPVPIVPTALSKNLSGPRSLSHLQGEPKTGYLTMDHTRKVLLALESDPKVFNLPIVGIWLSGVSFVYSPYTWAACLRFIYNSSINERVCSPPEPFLLILYSPVHSKPEFYEVTTTTHSSKMEFNLLGGYEVISVPKSMTVGPRGLVDIDLNSVTSGHKKEAFDGAVHSVSSELSPSDPDDSTSSALPSSDEITPRCIPAPSKSQLPTAMSMVPEVSLLFGEDGQSAIFTETGPKKLAINKGKPSSINHINDFVPQRPMTTLTNQQGIPVSSHFGITHHDQDPAPQPRMPHSHSAPQLSQTPQYRSAQPPSQPNNGAFRNVPVNPVTGQGVHQYMGNVYMPNNGSHPAIIPGIYNGNNPTSQQQMLQKNVRMSHQEAVNGFPQGMANGYSTSVTSQQHNTATTQQPSQPVPGHTQYQEQHQTGWQYGVPISSGDMNNQYRLSDHSASTQRTTVHPNTDFPRQGQMGLQTAQVGPQSLPMGSQPRHMGQQPGGHLGQQPGIVGQQPGNLGQRPGHMGQHPRHLVQQPGHFGQQPGNLGQQPLGQQPGHLGKHPGHLGQQPGQLGSQNYATLQRPQYDQGMGLSKAQPNPRLVPNPGPLQQTTPIHQQQVGQNSALTGPQSQYNVFSQSSAGFQPVTAVPLRKQHVQITAAPNYPQDNGVRPSAPSQIRPGPINAAVEYNGNVNNPGVQFDHNRSTVQGDSSKSSDDSGLSCTPEKAAGPNKNTSPCQQPSIPLKDSAPPLLGTTDINWTQVPKEVYQLLLQQDAQLKQLQAQIQTLMHNQSASTQHTTMTDLPSSVNSTGKVFVDSAVNCEMPQHIETCSVGINTTMFSSQNSDEKKSVQTSPIKMSRPSAGFQQQASRCSSSSSNRSKTPSDTGLSNCSNEGTTPLEIRHRGILPMNSTEREDEVEVTPEDLSCVVQNMALHNHTMDSVQSDMIVDIPSYHSSPTRSVSRGTGSGEVSSISKSPLSASMCGNQEMEHTSDADSEDEEDQTLGEGDNDTNTKEYYDKLMDNIHKLLSHQKEDPLTVENVAANEEYNDTLQQSIMLGQYLNTLHKTEGAGNQMDMTFIPKINYMSMIFDSDSDSSMEINAMAMKYLKDDQLTQLNKLHTRAAALKGSKEGQRLALLKHVLSDDKDSTPNVTTMGMSPNDMTFATRKYMEKHGLLSDSSRGGDDSSSTDAENYQLKVDYSTVISSSDPPSFKHDRFNSPFGMTKSPRIPVCQNVLEQTGSPFVHSRNTADNTRDHFVNSNNTEKGNFVNIYNANGGNQVRTPVDNLTPSTVRSTPRNDYPLSPLVTQGKKLDINHTPDRAPHRTIGVTDGARGIPNGHHMFTTPQRQVPDSGGVVVSTPNQLTNQYQINNRQNAYTPVTDREQMAKQRVLGPVTRDPSPPNQNPESQQNQFHNVNEDDKILDITRLKLLPKLL